MADSSAAVDRALLAFLNGICKRQFFGEEDVTDEFLRQDVLGGITEDGACIVYLAQRLTIDLWSHVTCVLHTEYAALLKRYSSILNSLASTDMDFNQLSAFLQSQMKKRQVGSIFSIVLLFLEHYVMQGALSESEAATVTRFWKNQKTKVTYRQEKIYLF